MRSLGPVGQHLEHALGDVLARDPVGLVPPLDVAPLGGGRSNLTYRVVDAGGRRVVVRRPPAGPILPTAHDVVREARIVGALATTTVPVAAVLAVSDDPSLIGAPFAVYDLVDGHAVVDRATAERAALEVRRAAGGSFVTALAALHAVDVGSIGLGELARPGNYVERQLSRWSRQWESSGGDHPVIASVHRRLFERTPVQQAVSLVHADPKLDNCLLASDGSVRAIVDWELATVGDPLADLGAMLAYWAQPDDETVALQDPPTRVPGFATRAELVAAYAARSTLDLADVPVYVAFALWRIACIVQGVVARMTARGDAGVEPFVAQVDRLAHLAAATLDP